MTSDIMEKIKETEQSCDAKIAEAKKEAAKITEKAELSAVEYRQIKLAEAKAKADKIREDAEEKAAQAAKRAEEDSRKLIADMRKLAEGNTARAVNAVAKQLVEWN